MSRTPLPRLEGSTRTVCRFRARTLKALAHPARLFMAQTLTDGERCVCELQEMVGLDVSTVSKHLSVLHGAGLLSRRRDGAKIFYRLSDRPARELIEGMAGALDALARQRARAAVARCVVEPTEPGEPMEPGEVR